MVENGREKAVMVVKKWRRGRAQGVGSRERDLVMDCWKMSCLWWRLGFLKGGKGENRLVGEEEEDGDLVLSVKENMGNMVKIK